MSETGDKIIALRSEGLTYKEIKAVMGVSSGTISYHCGAGQKEKTATRGRNRSSKVRQYIQKVKQESPCTDCGENYPYWMMDFDHVRGDKEFNVSRILSSIKKTKEEIAKCEVVCANCHRDRTHSRLVENGLDTPDIFLGGLA